MADVWWTPKGAKLTDRNWVTICGDWVAHAPVITAAGAAPESGVADLPTLHAVVDGLPNENPVYREEDVTGLHRAILLEGIYVLHKAANVLGGAQVHVGRGMCSWSLSSAYHAAFFAMKAIQHFLGFKVVEINSKSHMIDVMSEPPPLSSNQRKRGVVPKRRTMLLKLNRSRLDHQPMWGFLLRLIRVSNIEAAIWPTGCVKALLELADDDFAHQRNSLHYRDNLWPFDDLHACILTADFGRCATGLDDGLALDPERPDFSVILGLVLLRMAFQLFRDLVDRAPGLRPEWDILVGWLGGEWNELYQAAYPA